MPRFLALFFGLSLVFIATGTLAQNNGQLQPGDPPVASLITVSAPDTNGVVTITGAPGAVFPSAQLAIRNLYTEQLTYVQAGVTGTFSGSIYGPGNTPFWISPATTIPPVVRDRPGSLPGGPGTIIYGSLPTDVGASLPVTQIVIDGLLEDWQKFPQSQLVETTSGVVYGLRNTESLYVALQPQTLPESYWKLQVLFTLEGATYRLSLDPRLPEEAATLQDVSPVQRDRGTVGVSKTQADIVEMRIPLESLRSVLGAAVESASLERLEFVAADGSALLSIPVLQALPLLEGEVDGIVHTTPMDGASRFTIAGPIAQGAGVWSANGQINQLQLAAGDDLQMRLDVTLDVPALPDSLAGVSMVGVLRLQPVSGPDGAPVTGGLNSNNGWSAVRTPGGLAVDNLRSDFLLGETIVPAPQVVKRGDLLAFGMDFDLILPETLPAGMYSLVFEGYGQIADGERFRWDSNGLLGTGPGISRIHVNRLPLMLTVGEADTARLVWSLFQDMPSEGSRGLLSDADQERVSLSNRVRFNSPTYILPPLNPATDALQPYPLEPYLISQLPNAYDSSAAPLVPFLLPGGQLDVSVMRPDGTVQNFERTTLLQNQLSTQAQDERSRFGGQSQVDVYRLTTLNPALTDYVFDQYGLYTIEMAGTVDDVWGNTYSGGGTYEVLIAELMDMLPGVLSGAPFEVGDSFQAGLTLLPGVAADVTITAWIYPLDGGRVIEHEISGQANPYGYFVGEAFEFTTPGEYVVDYEARFNDAEGRLWAASTRSAGVIANHDSTLIAHGRRGLDGYDTSPFRPAWFTTENFGPEDGPFHFNFPFHSGDVLWYVFDSNNTVKPGITVQDTDGAYAAWAGGTLADSPAPDGSTVAQQAIRGELPVYMVSESRPGYNPVTQGDMLVNDAYTYVSVVRPGLTVRQFVLGTNDDSLPLYWDMDDPYNEQIGSGLTGDREGDFVFMFGGAVVRNEAAEVAETAIYGATAFVTANGFEVPGARVYPPYRGAAGGADGGPLLTVRGQPFTMFFHPTGIRPGQVLEVGDTLSIAGHVAPALASEVAVIVTSPSGERREFAGVANAIGYFYDPTHDFAVEEPGIWTVEIEVRHTGLSSAGAVESPYPTGGVLGAEGGRFSVYVVRENAPQLTWSDTRQDIAIPGALPFNLNFSVPEGWVNPRAEYTMTIPGYIIRSGPLTLSGLSFSFQHNPTDLNAAFPNIEVDARLDGPSASDPVSMTFTVTDDTGQIRTRTFTILYDRLLTLES